MTNTKKVEIGNIYNIGIGNGDSADCKVIRIEADSTNGDQAVLEMIEYGGPKQKRPVAFLEEKEVVNSEKSVDSQGQARQTFAQEITEEKADSKKDTTKVLDFFHSTIGLTVSHENLNASKLVRIDFYKTEDDNKIALIAVSGRTLNKIRTIKTVFVSRAEYEAKPHNPYNDSTTAIWALNKCGCSV